MSARHPRLGSLPAFFTGLQTWEKVATGVYLVLVLFCLGLAMADSVYLAGAAQLTSATINLMYAIAMGFPALVGNRRGNVHHTYRRWLAASWACWSLGCLMAAVEQTAARAAVYPTHGDFVNLFTVIPLACVGILMVPRRAAEPREWLRMLSEGIMLTTTLSVVVWSLGTVPQMRAPLGMFNTWVISLVFLELLVFCLAYVIAVRERSWMTFALVVASCLYAAIDVTSVAHMPQEHAFMRLPQLLGGMACSLPLSMAVERAMPEPTTDQRRFLPRSIMRQQLWTSSLGAGLLTAAVGIVVCRMAGVLGSRTPLMSPYGVVVLLAFTLFGVALWARDTARTHQHALALESLHLQANTDILTGVGNRRALETQLEQRWRAGAQFSLLTVDLDGFKDVNTLLGHGTGDTLLVRVGQTLASDCGSAEVFRLGGDEFAILTDAGEDVAIQLGEVVLDAVRSVSMELPGIGRVGLSCSVGVATAHSAAGAHTAVPGEAPKDWRSLMWASESAMRRAKASGKAQVAAYNLPMAHATRRRSVVEQRLRGKLERGGVDVRYQPLVNMNSRRVIGFEALAHWHDEELGLVPPAEFIPVAEDTGLITSLGRLVLERVVADIVAQNLAQCPIKISVNVSVVELHAPQLADDVISLLALHRIPSDRLVLEVTESLSVSDGSVAARTIQRLADQGVQIAVDDFGTGYSSLAYLSRLPVRILKLDRSLVAGLDQPRVASIAHAVVEMASALDLEVLAEGVESAQQMWAVRDLGVTLAQGWFFERALPADRLAAAVNTQFGSEPRYARMAQ